jgi:hypothetical protein
VVIIVKYSNVEVGAAMVEAEEEWTIGPIYELFNFYSQERRLLRLLR